LEVVLEPGGETTIEKNPEIGEKFEKWVYALKGKVTCVVRNVKYTLDKGDCLSFDSSITHSIENDTSARACCIVIQDPATSNRKTEVFWPITLRRLPDVNNFTITVTFMDYV